VLKQIKKPGLIIIQVLAFCFLLSAPVEAAVEGFIAKDDQGNLFQYSYEELLDSYALKVLGQSNGLYENYAEKEVYALVNSNNQYIDYKDVLDYYAAAIASGERFNLEEYLTGGKAKKAKISGDIKTVALSDEKIVTSGSGATTISNPGFDLDDLLKGFKPPASQSPIVGPAGALKEQAQEWAEDNDAAEELIEIIPIYWEYAEKTGMRPEILFAQAAVETNLGHYSDDVPGDRHNYAGILKGDAEDDDPENHESFADPEEGVRAHYNHMAAYTGLSPIGETHDRYNVAATQSWSGSVIYVEDLSGRWSPSEDYHLYILAVADNIIQTEVEILEEEIPDDPEEPDEDTRKKVEDLSDQEHVAVDVADITVLNLRSGPGTDHDILDRLVRGTVLKVTGHDGEWLEVITPDDKEGWVHGDYVRAVDLTDNPFKGNLVVLDPGHGGIDSGAIGITGLMEKEVNLAVAEYLKDMLDDAGARVEMTRSGDHSVSSSNRVYKANDKKADVFVSIHANSFSNPESNGIETYYCSNSDDSEASKFLAQQLQRELISALELRDRGVKANSFTVLRDTEMPSALVEIGFLSNREEEELLRKEETREKAAEALFKGLEAYLRNYRQ